MKTPEIPLSQIEIGERFRKDYGDIDQLAYSIKSKGLISPVSIGIADKVKIPRETSLPYILLAGGRRVRAMTKLGWTNIPVRIFDTSMTELDLRSIELAENFDRKDMEYTEEVALMRKINDLQQEVHGVKIGRSADASGWSKGDTARLLNKSTSTVTKDIQLAQAIESHPELQLDKCKNKTEAFKRLNSLGKILTIIQKAEDYINSVTTNEFKKLSNSYIIGDCFETMAKMPSNTLDFIEIDPPHAIDLHKVKKDNDCIGYNEISTDAYEPFLRNLFNESYRLLREGGWLVCWFAADPWFSTIVKYLKSSNFKLNQVPGMWVKPSGQTAQPETYLGNSYEMFFYARKGQSKLHKPGRSNIFQFNPVPPTSKHHPTQRPLDLMIELYSTFCPPNSHGFIPCLGSGVGLIAAHLCQINMIGTDLTSIYKDGYIVNLKETLKC